MRCGSASVLGDASVIVIPHESALIGWRDELAHRFPRPASPRSQCLAIDAAMVAAGELDVAILTFGGVWDFAATSLLVTEAGGVFRDAWGGTRLDTTTAVFTNGALVDDVLAELAAFRPAEPDAPRLAKTVTSPIGTEEEQAIDEWRGFGIRSMPSMSARVLVENPPPFVFEIVEERAAELERPFVGVTTDGVVRTGLRSLDGPFVSTEPILDAALAFLQALTPEQRRRACVRDGCHRVADVDQRPHEPLPSRRDARGPRPGRCASSPSTSCGRRCRPGASTTHGRSCGSTS